MTSEAPPFSRRIRVDAIPREGQEISIEANVAERAALAALNDLPAIGRLAATFTLKPGGRGTILVKGELSAELTQICVVTLEPFDSSVSETIAVRFAPGTSEPVRRGAPLEEARVAAIDEEDEPDPIIDGKIDLAALAAEFFILSLDPYPRKPGVVFESPVGGEDLHDSSPFGGLASSKKDP